MKATSRMRNHLAGLTAMTVGSLLIFGSVVMINKLASGPEATETADRSAFEIVRQDKPEPKQIVKPEPRREKPRTATPPNPLAGLGTDLSGIALDLPGFGMDSLDALQGDILGKTGDVVMTGDSVDQPPKPTYRRSPKYPVTAKANGVEGYVVLSVLISAAGDVEDVKVLEAHPGGVFEHVAVEGVQAWRFEPARYQGRNVRVWARQTVRFDLS